MTTLLAVVFLAGAFGWGDMLRDFFLSTMRKLRRETAPNVTLGDHVIATADRLRFSRMVAGEALHMSNESTWIIGGRRYRILITSEGDDTPAPPPALAAPGHGDDARGDEG